MNRQEKKALKATAKAVRREAKIAVKAARARKRAVAKKNRGDRIAQLVTIIAVAMATGYIILRVVGWARFAGV